MANRTVISEKTPVTIGVVVLLIGGVVWLTTLYSKVSAAEVALRSYTTELKNIDRRLSNIEGRLLISPAGGGN